MLGWGMEGDESPLLWAIRLNFLGSLYRCDWKIFTKKFLQGSGKVSAKIQGPCHLSATFFWSLTFLSMGLFFPNFSP